MYFSGLTETPFKRTSSWFPMIKPLRTTLKQGAIMSTTAETVVNVRSKKVPTLYETDESRYVGPHRWQIQWWARTVRRLMEHRAYTRWLRAAPETCVARLSAAREQRPLLGDEAEWRRRYAKREPLYRGLAQYIVDTDRFDVDTSLAALLRCVQPGPPVAGA